jgi:hypothetical protein
VNVFAVHRWVPSSTCRTVLQALNRIGCGSLSLRLQLLRLCLLLLIGYTNGATGQWHYHDAVTAMIAPATASHCP